MHSKYSKHDLRPMQFTDGHRVVSHRDVDNFFFWGGGGFEQIKDAFEYKLNVLLF